MAKKRKKARKSSASHNRQSQPLTLEAQEAQARELFAEKKYKEASECCKKLLKEEKRPEWLELLASVYHERSKALSAKGMYKEAVVIWRNRSELCGKPLVDLFYFQILFAADMNEQVVELYQHDATMLEQAGCLGKVREYLAALSLSQSGKILETLPASDILVKDYPVAMAALEAYCAGDDEVLHGLLRNISFRSPFRDLRQILKALSSSENNASTAKLLDRVAATSPFARFAEAASLSNEPEICLLSSMSKLTPEVTQFVMSKRGGSSQLLKFIEELQKLNSSPSAEALMRFISRHQKTLGKQAAREIALKLLVHLPVGYPVFLKAFGKPSPLELAQIEALKIELQDIHPMHAVGAWESVEVLIKPEDCESSENDKLSFALICHRKLKHADEIDHDGKMDDPINILLEWIITNDPKDRASYLRLIASYRKQGKLKEARRSLERAMKNLPDDIAILTEAVETALASKAYKKAAVLAKKILGKDPINTRVRTALIDAHLSHARKLIDNRKTSLAEKELDIAGSWVKTLEDKARVDLVCGTLLLDQKQESDATAIWLTATGVLGGGLRGYFYLLLELLRQNRAPLAILKKTEIKLDTKSLSKEQLLQFYSLIKSLNKEREGVLIVGALNLLKSSLGKAAKLKYSASDFDMICETLADFDEYDLSLQYAKEARKRWPNEQDFIYHIIAAETVFDDYLSQDNFDQLHDLIEGLDDKSEHKLKHRAISLIENSNMPPSSDFCFPPDIDTTVPPNMSVIIDILISSIPSDEVMRMKKEMGEEGFMACIQEMITNNLEPDMLEMLENNDDVN